MLSFKTGVFNASVFHLGGSKLVARENFLVLNWCFHIKLACLLPRFVIMGILTCGSREVPRIELVLLYRTSVFTASICYHGDLNLWFERSSSY